MAIMVQPDGFNLASRNGAKCSICGCGNTDPESKKLRPCISTGIVIDFEGSFDICMNCARELGGRADMIDRSAYDGLVADYAALLTQFNDQTVAFMDKEDAIRLLSGELVGASQRGVYGSIAVREVDTEPDFGGEA